MDDFVSIAAFEQVNVCWYFEKNNNHFCVRDHSQIENPILNADCIVHCTL